MQNMIDIWTKAVLAGAAVSFAAYLAMRHARRIACVSDWLVRVPRSRLAAFLLFAADRKNLPAVILAAVFAVCHLVFGVVNFVSEV